MAQQQDDKKDQSRQAGQPDRSFGSQSKTDTNTGMDKSRTSRSEDATQGAEELDAGQTSRDSKSESPDRRDTPKKSY